MVKNFGIKGTISFVLLCCLAGIEFAAFVVYRPDSYGLEGKYFPSLDWQGEPAFTSVDSEITSDTLQTQREKFPENQFSVEWTGYLDVLETADYTFFLGSDDGSRLEIDDQIVVDNGGMHGLEEKEGRIHLRKGLRKVRIRYVQFGGSAALRLFWKRGEDEKKLLDPVYFFPPQISRVYRIGKDYLPVLLLLSALFLVLAGDSLIHEERYEF